MNIYEIDEQIRQVEDAIYSLADEETGEITDELMLDLLKEKMNELQIERGKKIEGAAFLRREALDNSEIIGNEIKRLQSLKKAQDNRADNLLKYITGALGGEKFKTPFISITYRNTESVDVSDIDALPEQYVRVKKEANKTDLKKALKAGEEIQGVTLQSNTSTVVNYGKITS